MHGHELWLTAAAAVAGRRELHLAAIVLSGLGLTVLFERHVERWFDGELGTHLDQLIA